MIVMMKNSLLFKVNNVSDDWEIQIPQDVYTEGQQLLVQDLKASDSGGFYRIFGDIQVIQ